jgi:hypothetical protein
MAVSLKTTKGKKGEFVVKKMENIMTVDDVKNLLIAEAKHGMNSLLAMWKKLKPQERELLGNACPDAIKEIATDHDNGVPANLDAREVA